jgi:hypothetical protein
MLRCINNLYKSTLFCSVSSTFSSPLRKSSLYLWHPTVVFSLHTSQKQLSVISGVRIGSLAFCIVSCILLFILFCPFYFCLSFGFQLLITPFENSCGWQFWICRRKRWSTWNSEHLFYKMSFLYCPAMRIVFVLVNNLVWCVQFYTKSLKDTKGVISSWKPKDKQQLFCYYNLHQTNGNIHL